MSIFGSPRILRAYAPLDFLGSPEAYVLCETDEKGVCCPLREQDGSVTCHLMFVDALIEFGRARLLGRAVHVASAAVVDRDAFIDADGLGYKANVHLGWPARDGALLTRPSGRLGSWHRTLHARAVDGLPASFQVGQDCIDEVHRIREVAGMFAWQETNALTVQWPAAKMEHIAERALATINVVSANTLKPNQLALFDPEFERWHFVPYAQAHQRSWRGAN